MVIFPPVMYIAFVAQCRRSKMSFNYFTLSITDETDIVIFCTVTRAAGLFLTWPLLYHHDQHPSYYISHVGLLPYDVLSSSEPSIVQQLLLFIFCYEVDLRDDPLQKCGSALSHAFMIDFHVYI